MLPDAFEVGHHETIEIRMWFHPLELVQLVSEARRREVTRRDYRTESKCCWARTLAKAQMAHPPDSMRFRK